MQAPAPNKSAMTTEVAVSAKSSAGCFARDLSGGDAITTFVRQWRPIVEEQMVGASFLVSARSKMRTNVPKIPAKSFATM